MTNTTQPVGPFRCTCGDPIQVITEGDSVKWAHDDFAAKGRTTTCTVAVPDTGMPKPGDRAGLLNRIHETNKAYAEVRETLDDLRAALDDTQTTLDRAARPNPAVIRQAALSEAWDALLEAGHVVAGNVIANMLREDRLKAEAGQ